MSAAAAACSKNASKKKVSVENHRIRQGHVLPPPRCVHACVCAGVCCTPCVRAQKSLKGRKKKVSHRKAGRQVAGKGFTPVRHGRGRGRKGMPAWRLACRLLHVQCTCHVPNAKQGNAKRCVFQKEEVRSFCLPERKGVGSSARQAQGCLAFLPGCLPLSLRELMAGAGPLPACLCPFYAMSVCLMSVLDNIDGDEWRTLVYRRHENEDNEMREENNGRGRQPPPPSLPPPLLPPLPSPHAMQRREREDIYVKGKEKTVYV